MNRQADFPLTRLIHAVPAAPCALVRVFVICVIGLCVAQCMPQAKLNAVAPDVVAQASTKSESDTPPKTIGYDKTGKPYTVAGKLYVPREEKGYSATGLASWYGPSFHGRETANGEVFNRNSVSIAHPTMPLPSYVRVTNVLNGRSIIARVNDRGPFHGNRLVDVSEQVAIGLNFKHLGTARLKVDYIGRAPVSADDTAMLLASLRFDGTPAQLGRTGANPVVASAKTSAAKSQPALRIDIEDGAAPDQQPISQFSNGETGLPLPPVRPFAIGDSGFRPQFADLNTSRPTLSPKDVIDMTASQTDAPQIVSVPLPPVRPEQFSSSDDPSGTQKTSPAPKLSSPGSVQSNGFVPATVPVQRWNKGA